MDMQQELSAGYYVKDAAESFDRYSMMQNMWIPKDKAMSPFYVDELKCICVIRTHTFPCVIGTMRSREVLNGNRGIHHTLNIEAMLGMSLYLSTTSAIL